MTKINVSQICKIFNGSCFVKDIVRNDQLIMKRMTKSALFLLYGVLLKIPDTLW